MVCEAITQALDRKKTIEACTATTHSGSKCGNDKFISQLKHFLSLFPSIV